MLYELIPTMPTPKMTGYERLHGYIVGDLELDGQGKAAVTRVRTHYSHQMTIAARAIAAMKVLRLRSKRVAMRRQSLRRQNMRSMMLRCL